MALFIKTIEFYPAISIAGIVFDVLNVTHDSFFKFVGVLFVLPEVYQTRDVTHGAN